MAKFLNKYLFSITLVLIWLLFLGKGLIYLDPDFGWHLRLGNLITSSGIIRKDPFSYTMPDYPFVDHEWLSNVIIAKLYPIIGFTGLAILYSTLAILSIKFAIKQDLQFWPVLPVILAGVILLQYFGVRIQVETWFFEAILLKILSDEKLWARWRKFVPLLFLFWANLHGEVILGIFILTGFYIINVFQRRNFSLKNLSIILLSILATLINPYAIGLWKEIWMQLTDPILRGSIDEWLPLYMNFSLNYKFVFLIYATFFSILIVYFRKRFNLFELVMYFLLLASAIYSKRNISIWVIASLPLAIRSWMLFVKSISSNKIFDLKSKDIFLFFSTVVIICSFIQVSIFYYSAYLSNENVFYPKEALNYLSQQHLSGEIFTDYNWGGYLIWKLPDKKVFVDGRMPSWRWKAVNNSESSWAFKDYLNLVTGKSNPDTVFSKYNVMVVLLPISFSKNQATINNHQLKFTKTNNSSNDLVQYLERNKWRKVYVDEISMIYIKKS